MPLTLTFNDGDSDSFDCTAGSKKGFACGGVPPYAFTVSKGTIVANNFSFTITPPENTGSSVAGVAYKLAAKFCTFGGFSACLCQNFGCDDLAESACTGVGCGAFVGGCGCLGGTDECTLFADNDSFACPGLPVFTNACIGLLALHVVTDLRTPEMIAAGCRPCVVEMDGTIVTVTDSEGNSVSRTLET